jgi:probable HAF family extracellular repeat protein
MHRPSFARHLAMAGVLAISTLMLTSVAEARPSRWSITETGSFGTTGSNPTAINNRGEAVGWSTKLLPGHIAETMRCFVWDNGAPRDIGAPSFDFCQAMDVDDRGTVLAHTGYGDQMFFWQDGVWTFATNGIGMRMNRRNHIAGQYWNGSGFRGFLWRDGVQFEIGTFGGSISNASAVNDKDYVVGSAAVDDRTGTVHAFVWHEGSMRDLGTLDGRDDSQATDINSHGEVVGFTSTDLNDSLAFIAGVDGGMRELLPGLSPPSKATAINDHGDVVGTWGEKSYVLSNGALTLLEDIPEVKAAGWQRLFPTDINDRGAITGFGVRPMPGQFGMRGFVLSPR